MAVDARHEIANILQGQQVLVGELHLECLLDHEDQVDVREGVLYRTTQAPPRAEGEDDLMLTPEELCSWIRDNAPGTALLAGGNGVDRYAEIFEAQLGSPILRAAPGPSAVSIGRLGLARLARGERDDIAGSVPRYGRPPDITKPKK